MQAGPAADEVEDRLDTGAEEETRLRVRAFPCRFKVDSGAPVGEVARPSPPKTRGVKDADAPQTSRVVALLLGNCISSHEPRGCEEQLEVPDLDDLQDRPWGREEKLFVSTFHWRPEDFPLEIATYMQLEEPWSPERQVHRRTVLPPDGCRRPEGFSKVRQLCADNPLNMLEEETNFSAPPRASTTRQGCSGAAMPAAFSDQQAEWAASPTDSAEPTAESDDDGWQPDWSLLDDKLLVADAGGAVSAAAAAPGTAEPEHGCSLTVEDEVALLREQVKALRRENDLLRAARGVAVPLAAQQLEGPQR